MILTDDAVQNFKLKAREQRQYIINVQKAPTYRLSHLLLMSSSLNLAHTIGGTSKNTKSLAKEFSKILIFEYFRCF